MGIELSWCIGDLLPASPDPFVPVLCQVLIRRINSQAFTIPLSPRGPGVGLQHRPLALRSLPTLDSTFKFHELCYVCSLASESLPPVFNSVPPFIPLNYRLQKVDQRGRCQD